MRSMSMSASTVKIKFVAATVNDVKVGLEKPTMVKMVAEKYMREFCRQCKVSISAKRRVRGTYKAAELL